MQRHESVDVAVDPELRRALKLSNLDQRVVGVGDDGGEVGEGDDGGEGDEGDEGGEGDEVGEGDEAGEGKDTEVVHLADLETDDESEASGDDSGDLSDGLGWLQGLGHQK